MAFGNRRGPYEEGPRTGRGLGYCSGYDSPGYTKNFPRWGRGRGRCFNLLGTGRSMGFFGRGRGYRNMFYATGLPGWARFPYAGNVNNEPFPDEEDFLNNQVSILEEQLKSAKKRLEELKSEKEQK